MTDYPDKLGIRHVEGVRLRFRLVELDDADFIHSLRTDPQYGHHLSPSAPSVEAQRAWLEAYKVKEAKGQQYYFIIERRDGQRCGTMRIYDIGKTEATWGSFILDTAKPARAALDALMLVHHIIFDRMKLERALFDVRKANAKALALYRRLEPTEIGDDDLNIYFSYESGKFALDREGLLRALGNM